MPDFWQFPTGSMGIGPISSIYHARFMRYLTHRPLQDCAGRKVWGVFGDGEMDEPESMSALTLAAREKLDNLVWVVNCNLAGGTGPVIAATDYVRSVPESVRAYLSAGRSYRTLGTDGFGRRDTRAALRAFFQVDAASIVKAARAALAGEA